MKTFQIFFLVSSLAQTLLAMQPHEQETTELTEEQRIASLHNLIAEGRYDEFLQQRDPLVHLDSNFLRSFVVANNKEAVKFLLNNGVWLSSPGVMDGHEDLFAPDEKIDGEHTIVYFLANSGDERALDILAKKNTSYSCAHLPAAHKTELLFYAIYSKDASRIDRSIRCGVDINACHYGRTPLMAATQLSGVSKIVKQLLENGAHADGVKLSACSESTPLIAAIRNNDVATVKILLNASANPDLAVMTGDNYFATPLSTAIDNDNEEIFSLLMKAHVNPHLPLIRNGVPISHGSLLTSDKKLNAFSSYFTDTKFLPQALREIVKRAIALSSDEIHDDTLPRDAAARHELLTRIHQEIFPLLLSWKLAAHHDFRGVTYVKAPPRVVLATERTGDYEENTIYAALIDGDLTYTMINSLGDLVTRTVEKNYWVKELTNDAAVSYFWKTAIEEKARQEADIVPDVLLPENFQTPFPSSPHREPGMNRQFTFPGSKSELDKTLIAFARQKLLHHKMIKDCTKLLDEIGDGFFFDGVDEQDIFKSIDSPLIDTNTISLNEVISSVFTSPLAQTTTSVKKHRTLQRAMSKFFARPYTLTRKKTPISQQQIADLQALLNYHVHELRKIDSFIALVSPMIVNTDDNYRQLSIDDFFAALPAVIKNRKDGTPLTPSQRDAKIFLTKLKPFFLGGRTHAHALTNSNFLHGTSTRNLEVMVYDGKHNFSRHLNYSPLAPEFYFSDDDKKRELNTVKAASHSTGVAGVIAADSHLDQFKGVAPGAAILHVDSFTIDSLRKIKQSSARVINISRSIRFYRDCHDYFINNIIPASPPLHQHCMMLAKFINLVEKRDLLIVTASGNEGLPLDEVCFKSGNPLSSYANCVRGLQHERDIDDRVTNHDGIDFVHLYRQIPQLRNRLILVGNLKQDGKTIAASSNLPGAFPQDFIFAPSDGIISLYPTESSSLTDGNHKDHEELGEFAGTSGAAPRVAGVAAILGTLFPDLSMPTIKHCILDGGEIFDHDNNYIRVDAEAAYHRCLQKQEDKRQRLVTSDAITDSSYRREIDNPLYELIRGTELNDALVQQIVDYYKKHPQRPVLTKDDGFRFPLEIALKIGETALPIITTLLDNGPKLPRAEVTKILALHITENFQPMSLFEYCLSIGASLSDYSNLEFLQRRFLEVTYLNQEHLVQIFLRADMKPKMTGTLHPLSVAVYSGHVQLVEQFLAHGWDPNMALPMPALFTSVLANNCAITRLLLEHKADVNILFEGKSLLSCSPSPEMTALLTEYGAQ